MKKVSNTKKKINKPKGKKGTQRKQRQCREKKKMSNNVINILREKNKILQP